MSNQKNTGSPLGRAVAGLFLREHNREIPQEQTVYHDSHGEETPLGIGGPNHYNPEKKGSENVHP